MHRPRIYVNEPVQDSDGITLSGQQAHHVHTVLRAKEGSELICFDGSGYEYLTKIASIKNKAIALHIIKKYEKNLESPLKIHLYQGISRAEKMTFTLQKAVELGVTAITPIVTERGQVKVNAERWQSKQKKWQEIIIAACEQCGRTVLPTLHPVTKLQQLKAMTGSVKFILQPKAPSITQLPMSHKDTLSFIVGPESGFSDDEINHLQQLGATPVGLGPRVLRTETAALAAIAAMQTLWGDFL